MSDEPTFCQETRECVLKILRAAPAEVVLTKIIDRVLYTVDAISHETLENDKYRLRCFDSIRDYLFKLSEEGQAMQEAALKEQQKTPEERITAALALILKSGGVDGDHHKQWVLDQLVRILAPDYEAWVKEYEDVQEDGEKMYEWDVGTAP